MEMIKGYKSRARAYELARTVSTDPRVWQLENDTFVAVGETMLGRDGGRSRLLYGKGGGTISTRDLPPEAAAWMRS